MLILCYAKKIKPKARSSRMKTNRILLQSYQFKDQYLIQHTIKATLPKIKNASKKETARTLWAGSIETNLQTNLP